MSIKKHIPNFLTLCNLVAGSIGILFALDGNTLEYAPIFILIAAVFDFLDGGAARLLNVTSAIGKELDSLADMVSFGVLPGFILYGLTLRHEPGWVALLVLIVIPAAALRLAKFNVDDRQGSVFLGLPTPAAAVFVAGLPYLVELADFQFVDNTLSFILISLSIAVLMVVDLPLLSFKFSPDSKSQNPFRIITVVLSIIALWILKMAALPIVILFYLVISLIGAPNRASR